MVEHMRGHLHNGSLSYIISATHVALCQRVRGRWHYTCILLRCGGMWLQYIYYCAAAPIRTYTVYPAGIYQIVNFPRNMHGHLLDSRRVGPISIATPDTSFCSGVARGSRITPAPYEKAQASEEICKRAAHPSSKLNQKKCRVACACLRVRAYACMYVCICAYVLEMNVRMQVSNR